MARNTNTTKNPRPLPPRWTGSRISPSAMSRYETCPKQFLHTDIERLRPAEGTTPVLAQGNAVHDALYLFHGLKLEHRKLTVLEDCLRSCWRKHAPEGTFACTDDEITCGQETLQMLRSYAGSFD